MAEGLVNSMLKDKGVEAFSAGSRPSGRVNPNAVKLLKERGAWSERYRSKSIEEVNKDGPFDLVVTVCDNAKESCPLFPGEVRAVHVGFKDPDGKGYKEFEKTAELIERILLPKIEKELNL